MNELALFAGAGGGILGGHLLGWRTVCGVEKDPYTASVLVARQNDGVLPPFPIWDDIYTFDGRPWRGLVDVVSGGFPCQPFSSAARGRHVAVDLWPEMRRVVEEVRPQYVFAENVQSNSIQKAASDIAQLGYACRVARVDAAHMGAPHRRKRFWLVGHANSDSESRRSVHVETPWDTSLADDDWWAYDRAPLGMDDGVAHRMDKLRVLGNGQVPSVAAFAWQILTNSTTEWP